MANALLYCGRYDDTKILLNPTSPRQRVLIVNLANYPQVELPLAVTPCGDDCKRIAFLYIKSDELPSKPREDDSERKPTPLGRQRTAARKISASLAHERKMLSLVNVFAVLPVP